MRTQRLTLFILVFIGFVALVVLMSVSGNKPTNVANAQESMVVENASVEVFQVDTDASFVKQREVYGQVEATNLSRISFERAGVITQIAVDEGKYVKQGDVLAELDLARINAQKKELEASLNRAKAEQRIAQLSMQRVRDLVAKNLESPQRLDDAEARYDAAIALSNEVAARLESLNIEIQKSTIVAPFDGQISRRLVDVGTVINSGQAVFEIVDNQTLVARIGLPQETARQVQSAKGYQLTFNDQPLKTSLTALRQIRGNQTRTVEAIFDIEPVEGLLIGDLVKLSVDLEIEKPGAWLPKSALANGIRGLWTLYVVAPNTNTLEQRLVMIEYMKDDAVYVSGAIKDGERVVLSGTHRLTPGQRVNNITSVDNIVSAVSAQTE